MRSRAATVDAQLQCPIPNKVMTALSEQCDIRVLPYAPGQLETRAGRGLVLSPRRDAQGRTSRPRRRRGAGRGVVNILATHARTPEATVHDAVSAIVANTAELGRINPLFDGLGDLFQPLKTDGAKALEFGGVACIRARPAPIARPGCCCADRMPG